MVKGARRLPGFPQNCCLTHFSLRLSAISARYIELYFTRITLIYAEFLVALIFICGICEICEIYWIVFHADYADLRRNKVDEIYICDFCVICESLLSALSARKKLENLILKFKIFTNC